MPQLILRLTLALALLVPLGCASRRAAGGDGADTAEAPQLADDGDALPEAEDPDERFEALDDAEAPQHPVHLDDFPGIQRRGVLRVLIVGKDEEYLPRQGMPSSQDRQLIREFAARHGLRVQFVLAGRWDRLVPLLQQGHADLIASNLTITPARSKQVAFTRPVAVVQELVVGRRGDPALPRTAAELGGREVHVRQSSAFVDTLEELNVLALKRKGAPVKVVPAPEELDSEALVYQVSRGERPLTVADSHTVAAIQAYNDDVQVLFPIADGRQIAWATRKESGKLRTELDAFLIETALTAHTVERFTGDLAGIKKRGVLRVLTRNNPVTYFLFRGQQLGFDYELARLAAKALGVRLEMVVPPSRDLLIPWLLEGRGDLIAASFSVTEERARQVAFTRPYLFVQELLVQRVKGPRLKAPAELAGKRIHVRRSSSYRLTLEALQSKVGPFEIVDEAEDLETEDLIAAVAAGQIPFTVADSHILDSERSYRGDIQGAFPLTEDQRPIAFAVRPDNPELKGALDRFVQKTYRGVDYNIAKKRYFESRRQVAQAKTERAGETGALSPYDAIIKRHSARYALDWRLMAAQAYQESRFDPRARSWVGARGLFQVMPATGREMGFERLDDPDEGTHAGVKYLHRLINQFEPTLPFRQRVRFALAAYNAGYGHVADARRLAKERGLNPNRWFENVEKAMLLLEKPQFYRRARHGYCRGSEPVKYVSEIQNRYDNYVKILSTVEAPRP